MPDNEIENTSPPLLLIVGAPRSGTTLMSLCLEGGFGYTLPLETHFVPIFSRWAFLFGDLSKRRNRLKMAKAIMDFLKVRIAVNSGTGVPQELVSHTLLAVEPELDKLVDSCKDYKGLVSAMFTAYAESKGTARVGDKLVPFAPVDLDKTTPLFSNVQVLHLIRDGRDVATSWMKTYFGPATVSEAAELWGKHVERYSAWGRRNPDRYLEIRFEDLLGNPDQIWKKLEIYLGIKPVSTPHCAHMGEKAYCISQDSPHHVNLAGRLDSSKCYKWKKGMRPEEIAIFERQASATLRKNGYELQENHTLKTSQDQLNIPAGIRRTLLRSVYACLPVAVWTAMNCRFELSTLIPKISIFAAQIKKLGQRQNG